MAYRFNNGSGGVTCDTCDILYDVGLSAEEYKRDYNVNDSDYTGDHCWRCKRAESKDDTDLSKAPELPVCPFCGGEAVFERDKAGNLIIKHEPARGVVCPARYYQACDTFEQGATWWSTRA